MYAFQIVTDNVKAIARAMGCCESVRSQHPYYMPESPLQQLLKALSGEELEAGTAAAQKLIEEAVPEVGEIHPQRASIVEQHALTVTIQTPGGVQFRLSPAGNEWALDVVFGRRSVNLATEMLCSLVPLVGAKQAINVDRDDDGQGWPEDTLGQALASLLLEQIEVEVG